EAAGQLVRDRARLSTVVDDLKREMVLLPPDYLRGANGSDWKPALYLTVRVVKFLLDRQKLFVDQSKAPAYRPLPPYHPNAQALNQDLGGSPLPIGDGAYCHYPTNAAKLSRSLDCIRGPITRMVHGWW
ncbi:MAG: hypothetical protein GY832_42785, partial [Chloroflexi bacterium]|nr:hypothetical protein [Chloroflexota bacterium]